MLAGTAQAASVDKSTVFGLIGYVAVLVVNVVPMCGYAWIEWRRAKQNDQRDNALAEVSQANRDLEAMLAENAALHERLLAQAREAGVLDERQRMAREIHDTLAQGLTGIITQLQAVEQVGGDPAQWQPARRGRDRAGPRESVGGAPIGPRAAPRTAADGTPR